MPADTEMRVVTSVTRSVLGVRMFRTRAVIAAVAIMGSVVVVGTPTAGAAPVENGREWRELYTTTGLSWSQIASVCPTDGVTACSGSVGGRNLTGWTWATVPQVRDLMDDYAPGLATADVVSGIDGFWGAVGFLGVMRWTTFTSLTYFYSEWTGGWTASTDPLSGLPIGAGAGYSTALTGTTSSGSIGFGTSSDTADSLRGVFLFRTAGLDYTPPVVTPTVNGTLGSNGWYRSNVDITWAVTDAESPIVSTTGCDPVSLASDSAVFSQTCSATSAGFGGPGVGSVTVKRDATAPSVTCNAAPTYTLGEAGATVSATVADGLSGPAAASVSASVSTAVPGLRSAFVTGFDRAGNGTSQPCGYVVAVPQCLGRTPTMLGTGENDVLTGTAGIDVIHGLSGNDTISGLGKGDIICGGDGNDLVYGGYGNDLIDGGAGSDDLNGDGGLDTIDGGLGDDSIRGGAGADKCTSGEIRMSSCATLY